MAEKSWLFNSVNGDRAYNAEDIGAFLAPFFSGGIFANPSTNLQVTADGSGMTVTVQPGYALVKGADGKLHMYQVTAALALTIATADGANNRIDRIVVRMDTAGRIVSAQVKQGAYAASPTAPTVEQDADYWELALADVLVNAGTTAITQSMVTDQRLNTAVCGVVAATVQQLDTTTLFNQYQTWLNEQIAAHASDNTDWQNQMAADLAAFKSNFATWFDYVKGVLDADTAGHLLNLVNGKTDKTVPATAGNLAALNGDGTLADSGKKSGDFAAASHAATHHTGGSDPLAPVDIGAAITPTSVTVTLPVSGWTLNSSTTCYEQTVSVSGLLTTDGPKTALILPQGSTDAAAQLLTDEAYGCIFAPGGYAACTTDGQLYCRGPAGGDKPQVNFPVDVVFHR